MAVKNPIIALVLVLLLTSGCASIAATRSHEPDADIAGVYLLSGSSATTLEIQGDNDGFVAFLAGGSAEGMDAAAPADCYVKARGTLRGKTLEAAFAPVATETFFYDQARADRERRRLSITFGPGTAEVTGADTFGYCGMGTRFLGLYRRTTRTQPPSGHP